MARWAGTELLEKRYRLASRRQVLVGAYEKALFVTHLHLRSWFSFGAGASSPRFWRASMRGTVAARHGQSALALTDLHTLAGAVRHARACRDTGLHPVFGATVSVDDSLLVLLCADGEGDANLCNLLTRTHLRAAQSGDRKHPHLLWDDLRGHTSGLFCLSGGHEGTLCQWIQARQWSKARSFARVKGAVSRSLLRRTGASRTAGRRRTASPSS